MSQLLVPKTQSTYHDCILMHTDTEVAFFLLWWSLYTKWQNLWFLNL